MSVQSFLCKYYYIEDKSTGDIYVGGTEYNPTSCTAFDVKLKAGNYSLICSASYYETKFVEAGFFLKSDYFGELDSPVTTDDPNYPEIPSDTDPTFNCNYILSIEPIDEIEKIIVNKQDVDPKNARINITTQYFDGLGRLVETVQIGIIPSNNDLVSLKEYDDFGRESNVWLPGTSSANGGFVDPQDLKQNILNSALYTND